MHFWQSLIFAETEQLLEIARTADDLGFTGLVLPDHIALPEHTETSYPYSDYDLEPTRPFLDPWPAIASMAAVTTKLLFSTYVYVLPMRDPFSVAKSLATTALLSEGRVALGAGVGWLREEIELLGYDFESRGKRCDEMLDVMRMLLTEGSAELHGETLDFPRVHSLPLPGHSIPIYIGGHSSAAIRRAARYDGWMGLDFSVDEVPALIERIREARSDAGRASEPFEIFLSPRGPADRDTYRRLEDMGVTATLLPSWAILEGDFDSLEAKKKQMEATVNALF